MLGRRGGREALFAAFGWFGDGFVVEVGLGVEFPAVVVRPLEGVGVDDHRDVGLDLGWKSGEVPAGGHVVFEGFLEAVVDAFEVAFVAADGVEFGEGGRRFLTLILQVNLRVLFH